MKAWQDRANCRGVDPGVFYPEPVNDEIKPARPRKPAKRKKNGELTKSESARLRKIEVSKQICATCPVQLECQGYADSTRQKTGTFAGETSEERVVRWRSEARARR